MKRTITLYSLLAALLLTTAPRTAAAGSPMPAPQVVATTDSTEVFEAGAGISEDDADDFPSRYLDEDQNRRTDGTPSATVARLKRGGYYLVPDSLFRYPRFSKFYSPKKRFGDKIMVDVGIGANWGTARDLGGRYHMGTQPEARFSVADLLTPEHGWRVAFNAGRLPLISRYNGGAVKSSPTLLGLDLDYLMNISAISSRTYDKPRKVEVYGVAGLDADYIRYINADGYRQRGANIGGHIGLRTVFNYTPQNYFFLEPRVSVYHPGHALSYMGSDDYGMAVGLTAGMGLRKYPGKDLPTVARDTLSSFGNDWFVQGAAGLGVPLDDVHATGPHLMAGIGKWLTRLHGLRVRFSAHSHALPPQQNSTAALGVGMDYLWNITRAFSHHHTSERTQEHRFGVNLVVGVSGQLSDQAQGTRHSSFGYGGGLQLNYRIRRMSDFYLEPRIDFYGADYLYGFPEANPDRTNVVTSLLAGFTFHQGMHTKWLRQNPSDDFVRKAWFDHLFFQLSGGATTAITTNAIRSHQEFYLITPKANIAVGKWITPYHGVRLYAEGGALNQSKNYRMTYNGALGAEYLWNISNALAGYRRQRPFEFVGAIGVNFGLVSDHLQVYPGLSMSLQSHYNITENWSLFLEPQLRVYSKYFMQQAGSALDPIGSMMLGVQIRSHEYDRRLEVDNFRFAKQRTFYSAALGYTFPLKADGHGWGGRISMGRWVTPVSGVRGNFAAFGSKEAFHDDYQQQLRFMLGGDYLFDIINMAYGYNPERRLGFRPLVGVNAGLARYSQAGLNVEGDVHTGAQFALRVARLTELYLEPQVAYNFAPDGGSRTNIVTPTVYLGFNHSMDKDRGFFITRMIRHCRAIREHNFSTTPWDDEDHYYNKLFFEAAMGPHLLWSRAARQNLKGFMGFGGHMAVGRWFSRFHAVKARLYGARDFYPAGEYREPSHRETFGFGVEYGLGISNAIWGYNPDRLFDLNGFAGPTFTFIYKDSHLNVGGNIALQGLLNFNRTYSIFIQPEITFYKNHTFYHSSLRSNFTTDLMLGLQVHPANYDRKASLLLFDESDEQSFVSMAGGLTVPLRALYSQHNRWGGVGRVSYGRWFLPTSAWRLNFEGWAYRHNIYNDGYGVRAGAGADYLFDITTLAYGFNTDRLFNLRALAGLNLGVGYMRNMGGRAIFQSDLHVGGQAAIKLGSHYEIFAEPTVGYMWDGHKTSERLSHVFATMSLGLNYRIKNFSEAKIQDDADAHHRKHFLSISGGTGCNTTTLIGIHGFRRKLSIDLDANYGYQFTPLSGVRVGVNYSNINLAQKKEDRYARHNVNIHADYVLNLLRLFHGCEAADSRLELNAIAGFNYTFSRDKVRPKGHGFGAEAGVQIGGHVTDAITLFVEPGATITSSKIYQGHHPFDGTGRILAGLKYAF